MSILDKVMNSVKSFEQIQSDWNQNDESQKDFIKNRPFYSEDKVDVVVLFPRTELDLSSNISNIIKEIDPDCDIYKSILDNQDLEYVVYWNDEQYKCRPTEYFLGNYNIYDSEYPDTGEPFVINTYGYDWDIMCKEATETVILGIEQLRPYEDIVKIPEKYLPDSLGECIADIYDSMNEISSKADEIRNIAEKQVDWNQNDDGAIDFVKNRTHYTEWVKTDRENTYGIEVAQKTTYNFKRTEAQALRYFLDDCYIMCGGLKYNFSFVKETDDAIELSAYISHVNYTVTFKVDKNLKTMIVGHDKAANKRILIQIYYPMCELAYHALREEYIPDTIARVNNVVSNPVAAKVGQTLLVKAVDENGNPTEWEAVDYMVVPSSVESSTKRFKISVDDNGILSAIEII